jgi:hypothetical protein
MYEAVKASGSKTRSKGMTAGAALVLSDWPLSSVKFSLGRGRDRCV